MSLDGYYSGANEDVDAIWKYHHKDYKNDRSFYYYNIECFQSSDTVLLGKKTFLGFFNESWLNVLNDPQSKPFMRDLAYYIVNLEKIVVSDTLQEKDLHPKMNTKIIRRSDVYRIVTEMKSKQGKDIVIIGSKTLWQDLLSRDFIDELHITIAPVISGEGTQLFVYQPEIYLKRIDTRIASGNVTVCFKICRKNE